MPAVERVVPPSQSPRQVAPDQQAAYATLALRSDASDVREILPAIQQALRPTPLEVTLTGAPVFYADIFEVTERDLRRAELLSIPLAAIALVLVFGSLVAGFVPGVIGGTSVAVTLALMVIVGQAVEMSIFSLNLVSMLGLGLGIDYSLFIVSRFREERARATFASGWDLGGDGRQWVIFSGRYGAHRPPGAADSISPRSVRSVSPGDRGWPVRLAALTLLAALASVVGPRIDVMRSAPWRPRGSSRVREPASVPASHSSHVATRSPSLSLVAVLFVLG